MYQLVECVPNISEGRRPRVVAAIVDAVLRVPGVTLLDRTSDADHDRSVLTLVGAADAVLLAMQIVASQAIARIDLRSQHGQHPRIGALDVVPFVPLGDTSMDTCIELAGRFGTWLAEAYTLPVYLYARAARRPDRGILADIRRPAFEGLAAALAAEDGAPDFGPQRAHPTAGATVVGARPFLIAWNIQLETNDRAMARRIATTIRERDGGLSGVQALGIPLASTGCVQVSMNLLDHARTPMWRVFERVRDLAAAGGVAVRDTELVGLAPVRAFLDVADHAGVPTNQPTGGRVRAAAEWLQVRDASPQMALELRLAGRLAATDRPAGDPAAG
ncbi:MAG: glutamate formimidoyltransferase [Chloroflexi bacterium]|nr:glutamate formimidoyltransferase [Chloroflexota bacterium]